MEKDLQKKSSFKAQFNSLETDENDPTILHGKVIIHDFEKSWNNQVITEQVCSENMKTLIGKRIVCKYISAEDNSGTDALGSHEEKESKDREGNPIIITDTIAIGFIENVYIDDYTDENGITKKVLYGDIIIWNDDKYANVVELLQEWLNNNVKIHMSVEYLYCNYNVVDGVEFIQSPIIYVAHTLLNSENRGEAFEIEPAYDSASLISLNDKNKWNKAIAQLINKQSSNQPNNNNQLNTDIDINNKINNQKEDNSMAENKFYKALCELSHGDVRDEIMTALSRTMTAEEFQYIWISSYGIYDSYFVYENYENNNYVNYKVPYTKTETEVVIDLANKSQVERDTIWVEVGVMETSVNALKEQIAEKDNTIASLNIEKGVLDTTISEKETTIESLNSTITTLTTEKDGLSTKFEESTNSIAELSKQVNEMKPIVDTYNTEKMEQALNEKKSLYENKFKAVNAKEKFDSEDVQNLIKLTINDNDEGKNAINSLNSMIADAVVLNSKPDVIDIKETAKSTNNLIDVNLSFEKRYGFND